jgi:hypothetical protein
MAQLTPFPAPLRMGGKLLWEQFEIENFKRSLIGLEPLDRDHSKPIVFMTAKQISAELPYARRGRGSRSRRVYRAARQSRGVGMSVDRRTWRGPNYLGCQDSAEELSLKLMNFWRERGHTVQVRVEKGPIGKAGPVFKIRSDSRNGLPIGARSLAMAAE